MQEQAGMYKSMLLEHITLLNDFYAYLCRVGDEAFKAIFHVELREFVNSRLSLDCFAICKKRGTAV